MRFTLLALFSVFFILPSYTSAKDRDKQFSKGRGGPWRGNEHSQRPGHINTGRPNSGGNGCPQGSMSVVWAPDNLSFSILFDQFVAQTENPGQRRDVLACDALIPIELPPNMQMEITRVDYRGFVSLPDRNSRARLRTVINFRGRGGDGDRLRLRMDFDGPVEDNYVISTDLLNGGGSNPNPEISPCGGTVNLRVYNQLEIKAHRPGDQAMATIDSIDGTANAVYQVNWRQCRPGRP